MQDNKDFLTFHLLSKTSSTYKNIFQLIQTLLLMIILVYLMLSLIWEKLTTMVIFQYNIGVAHLTVMKNMIAKAHFQHKRRKNYFLTNTNFMNKNC